MPRAIRVLPLVSVLVLPTASIAQEAPTPTPTPSPTPIPATAAVADPLLAVRVEAARAAGLPAPIAEATGLAVTRLLAMQEGEPKAQWPYEGVYRVRGEIPFGYRIGGTSIVAMALLAAPGVDEDAPRRDAILRAAAFVAEGIEHPLMSPRYRGGYDVRGWGYAYGLRFLARLAEKDWLGGGEAISVPGRAAIEFYLAGLAAIEIPEVGGWNYARRGPLEQPSPAAPFMTAPCVRSLLEARRAGFEVSDELVARALDSLEASRGPDGTYAYSAAEEGGVDPASRPGAIGRMVSGDAVLLAAGRLDQEDLRRSVESFLAYWPALDARRAKGGTHVAPYGVAPYYFMFAHGAAGEAIEMLPPPWRGTARQALLERLMQVRAEDGTWNDRVFERSSNYGTALAIDALIAPIAEPMPRWSPPAGPSATNDAGGEETPDAPGGVAAEPKESR